MLPSRLVGNTLASEKTQTTKNVSKRDSFRRYFGFTCDVENYGSRVNKNNDMPVLLNQTVKKK